MQDAVGADPSTVFSNDGVWLLTFTTMFILVYLITIKTS